VGQYVASAERAGVAAVALGFADQQTYFRNSVLIRGVPEARWVDVPRIGTGPERVATFIDAAIKALTDPLTDKEKESGMYNPPPLSRICFTGTLLDAQEFYQKTTPVANCGNCPIATYTDGLPIVIPTEQRVKQMLTGTSHQPEELMSQYTRTAVGGYVKATNPMAFASAYRATVETVATIAVMAGCKPEYLPVVLAGATAGGGSTECPGTNGPSGFWYCVTGPYGSQIGMNSSQGAFNTGNPPDATIGRAMNLITVNLSQCLQGVLRTDSGQPFTGRLVCAEDESALPPGWLTLREESGYDKSESFLGKATIRGSVSTMFSFESFSNLNKGIGDMARDLGVEGKPGNYNFMAYVAPRLIPIYANAHGWCFVMDKALAQSLYDYGFKTKNDFYNWLFKTYKITEGQYKTYGWWDFRTSGGEATEPQSGLKYNLLPSDFLVTVFGQSAANNCVITISSPGGEQFWGFGCHPTRPSLYSIDAWR